MSFTPKQLSTLQHTIGADQYGRRPAGTSRNHFVTDPTSDDGRTCESLVALKLMSFAMTAVPFYRRQKFVTRRLGWTDLRPGELVCGAFKCQGLAKNESPIRMAIIRIEANRLTPLRSITPRDITWEGFPGMPKAEFISMFCDHHRDCTPATKVSRIQFSFIPGGRFDVPGFCRKCGCYEEEACFSFSQGNCWWVDNKGRAALGQTTLCSHCFHGFNDGLDRAALEKIVGQNGEGQ